MVTGIMSCMGSSKHASVARQIDRRIVQMVTRPQPISLSEDERQVKTRPVHRAERPRPVRAWVRFPETPIETDAMAIAWTDRAVLVEWRDADGRRYECWVWASAVESVERDR